MNLSEGERWTLINALGNYAELLEDSACQADDNGEHSLAKEDRRQAEVVRELADRLEQEDPS